MKLVTFNYQAENTTYLQGVARWVLGTPAGDLKVGDTLVWNGGGTSTVHAILKETAKQITIQEYYANCMYSKDKLFERKMLKTRIVARPANELPAELLTQK